MENYNEYDEYELSPEFHKRDNRARSRRRWRKFLVIYSVIFLLVGAAGCFVLYRYSEAYEKSLPEHVMDDLMAAATADDWYETVVSGEQLPVTEFEDGDSLFRAFYDATLRSADFSYRKAPGEFTAKTPVYHIRAAGSNLCKVTLIPKGENAAGFGRQLWQVGSIEPCYDMSNLESVTVEIDAPKDESIYINGSLVSEKYLTEEKAPCPDMNPLESRFAEVPFFARYRVDALYGDITVTDSSGRELQPEIDSERNLVRYTAPEDTFYSFSLRAPEGVKLSVCGAELSDDDATSASEGILAGLDAYTGGAAYQTLQYAYEKLYSKPESITAEYNGTNLTPLLNEKGELIYFYPGDEALKEAMTPIVENFFNCYVNYSAKAYNDVSYVTLLGCILPGTDLYNYVRDSVDAMIWASATEVNYDELDFEDFCAVGENCFTCTIRYKADFSATSWYESYSYDMQNAYELAFVRQGETWYAAAMSSVAG